MFGPSDTLLELTTDHIGLFEKTKSCHPSDRLEIHQGLDSIHSHYSAKSAVQASVFVFAKIARCLAGESRPFKVSYRRARAVDPRDPGQHRS